MDQRNPDDFLSDEDLQDAINSNSPLSEEDRKIIREAFKEMFGLCFEIINEAQSASPAAPIPPVQPISPVDSDQPFSPQIGGRLSLSWEDFKNGKRTRLWDD